MARTAGAMTVGGALRGDEEHGIDMKNEKAFRETLSPLISHETAKSGGLRSQRFQGLGKTQDFAGEAISLRFHVASASRLGDCGGKASVDWAPIASGASGAPSPRLGPGFLGTRATRADARPLESAK
jgi:hypothetical protein